jgi:class 3 adenylate cyclase
MATERAVERRVVSVLFADLVGFTSLSEELDAEDVTLVQDAYFEAVRETVARHGGQLEVRGRRGDGRLRRAAGA